MVFSTLWKTGTIIVAQSLPTNMIRYILRLLSGRMAGKYLYNIGFIIGAH